MSRSRIAKGLAGAALSCAAGLAATAMVSAVAANPKFTVGVLRRDGLLIPFASFNGSTWTVPWPGSSTAAPLPISIDDIPKAWWGAAGPSVPWTAWLDGQTRPLKLERPVHVPIFCGAHLAIGTDYRGAPPTEREPTVAKDGVATAGNVTVEPIVAISLLSADAVKMLATITDKFNDEEGLAATHFTAWRHPFGPDSRAARPIELEAFYRTIDKTKSGTYRTSYIEAVRRYPALFRDQGCGLVSFARGWITEVPGKKPIINLGVRITYCDRAEVTFIQPFGRVIVDGGRSGPDDYWIYQLSSWREEFYSVAHVAEAGVKPLVVVSGGSCPKDPAR